MIAELTLENILLFRQPVTIRVRPITLMIGPNGSGKSTITRVLESIQAATMDGAGGPCLKAPQIPLGEFYGPGPEPGEEHDSRAGSRAKPSFNLATTTGVVGQPARYHFGGEFQQGIQNGEARLRLGITNSRTGMKHYWDPGKVNDESSEMLRSRQSTQEAMEGFSVLHTRGHSTRYRGNTARLKSAGPERLQHLLELAMTHSGAAKIGARSTPEGIDLHDGDGISLASRGRGVRNFLNLASQALAAPRGATIVAENPEDGQDPSARLELGTMFFQIHQQHGINSIIETQSDDLLLQLRTLTAQGHLDPQALSIAFFTGNREGAPTIRNISVNPDGSLEPGLPMDFFGANVIRALEMGAARRRQE